VTVCRHGTGHTLVSADSKASGLRSKSDLAREPFGALISRMGTKTTFICDCCLREADSNLGWARAHINGASGDKQLLPDDDRDLCEICWSPLQVLMKKVHAEARARRSSSNKT
jgi:hypothetical protein